MADVATAPNPNQQVPLDTIPISPSDDNSSESKDQSSTATSDGDIRTVFHDPENFNVKHPLMNTWTLWFTKPPSGKVCFCGERACGLANMHRVTTGMTC
jgi:translation initiation factor 4E